MILLFFNAARGGGGAPNQFTPPIRDEIPRVEYTASDVANRLSGHFTRGGVGVNVYKLVGGGYTEQPPADPDDVEFTYFGGRHFIVSDAEKALLEAANYVVD